MFLFKTSLCEELLETKRGNLSPEMRL